MSKIKTNYIEPRVSDSTVTIGTHDGHVRIIGKSVEIQGHPNDVEIGNLLEGYESLYIYITRDEFKHNSNKCFIQNVEPAYNPDAKFPVKPGDVWLNSDLENWRVYSIKNNVGAWRVPQIETDVQKLKEDVVALEGEIEALITLDEKGSWEATLTDDVQPGQVYFSTPDFTSKEIAVKISKMDTDSNAHMFSTVTLGTWIEFIEDDADYCLGQVTLFDNEDDDFFEATLNVSVGKGEIIDESNVRIRAFEATEFDPASIRIVDIDDTPPVEPKEGDLWFDNNSSDMTLRVFHEASEAWLAVAPATTVEGRVAAGEATQRAMQAQIDDLTNKIEMLEARGQ